MLHINKLHIGVFTALILFIYYSDLVLGIYTIILPSLIPLIYIIIISRKEQIKVYGLITLIVAAFAAEQAISNSRFFSISILHFLIGRLDISDYYAIWLFIVWYLLNMTPSILAYASANLIDNNKTAIITISAIFTISVITLTAFNIFVIFATSFE